MKNFTQAFFTTKSKSIKWVFAMFALFLLNSQSSFAQLLTDDFTGYTTSANLATQTGGSPSGTWTKGGTGPDATVINTTPLTYSGYVAGGGNYVAMPTPTATGSRVYKGFTSTTAIGNSFYASFLLRISARTATGDYFISLGDPLTGTNYGPRIFARTNGAGFSLGISKSTNTAVYGSTVFNLNQTYLVVLRFSGVTGAANDTAYLYVNPSLASEPLIASAECSDTATADAGYTGGNIGNFVWHNRSVNNPTGAFDGVRVATGSTPALAWASLAPASAGPSTDANLSAFTTTATGFTPTFSGAITAYSATTTFATATTTVTATRNQAAATLEVRVNGGTYTSLANATASGALALNVGANTIDVRVTAEDAVTQKVYTLTVTRAAASTVSSLSALTTTAGALTPSFASGTISYTASVANATTSVTVTPTRTNAGATIQARVNGGSYTSVTSGSPSGALNLNVGANTIEVLVTAEDAVTTTTYTITVTRSAAVLSNVATLSDLTTTAGAIAPTFASGTTAYTASVANGTTSVTVTPTKTDAGATIQVRVNGGSYTSVASGTPSGALALNVGANTINVLVTAEDTVTTITYTITVTRAGSSDATLSALTTSAIGLAPAFASGTTAYTASVPFATTTATVTATRNQANATLQVRVNGGTYGSLTSGSPSGAQSLNVGANTIDVLVTAQDGITTSTYTITVTRAAASTVATLSALSLNTGAISPTFASGTIAYSQTVANAISGVNVTATVTDATATIRARTNATAFATITSGVASSTLGLVVGVNTLDVEVTAQDGTTIIIYTVTITRSLSADSSLSALSTTAGTLSPSFAGGTFSYNIVAAVPFATAVTVSAARAQANATMQVRVNGGSYSALPNATATSVSLAVGANTIDVLVTAQNGTTSTYSITATRAAASTVATLSALTTTAGTLTPSFATGTTSYTASVTGVTASVTVTPTRTEANATIQVRVNGGSYASVTSGSPSGALALNVGNNPIDVLVTAQDGTTTATYTITVNRAAPPIWSNTITGTNPGNSNPYTTGDAVASNLTVSGIGRFASAFTSQSGNDRYINSTLTVSPTIDLTKYIEFTLTPAVTYKIDFTDFKFNAQLSAGAGAGASIQIRSNVDSYASNIVSSAMANSASPVPFTIDLSGGSFQNVQTPITFRIYLTNSIAAGSTFSINDFEFNGSVAIAPPAPEMNVVQGTSIASGGTRAFGNQENGTNSGPVTFTIQNLGNAILNLNGAPNKVAISGTNASEFTINETATTATVAATSGTTTFTVTFTPGTAGAKTAQLSIANDDATGGENPYLINLTGTSTTSQLSTIAAASFTAPTNIAYGSFQANDITAANSVEVGRFTIQDSASDNDSFGTILSTLTLGLSNSANIKRVALYDGATELQEIAAGATNVFNAPALAANLFTTDGGSKTFSVRVTFNSTVTDNQNYQFTATAATADAAGSGFATVGGTTSIAGNDNRIEVTANRLTFGTVIGSSFGVPLPSFTITTTDGLGNVDTDRSAAVTLGSTSGFPSANFTRTTPTYALTGGSITISNVAFADAQDDINLTADASGLTQGVSDPFDILLVTWPAGSYRTLTGGTYPSTGGITWEQFVANAWGPSGAPGSNESNTIYIRHNVSIGAFSPQRIIVEAGTLTYTAATTNAVSMLVQSGATLQINAALTVNGTFTVESGGTVNVNNSTTNGASALWNGTEDFQDGSTVNIQNWEYGNTNRLIENPSNISVNTTSSNYFGNLTISGSPSSQFAVVDGTPTINLCKNDFTVNESGSNNVTFTSVGTATGANITIGGNVIVNAGQLSVASGTNAIPVINVLGNITVRNTGTLNLNQANSVNTRSTLFLKGNLSVETGGTLNCTDDGGATGTKLVFNGNTVTQTLSVAGTLGTNVTFDVGDEVNNTTVQLINQDLNLANSSNNVFVKDKGVLDFNFRNITGLGTFTLEALGEVRITSAAGLTASGATGNVTSSGTRTISQSGIFRYTGNVTPQATGTAMGTGSSAKRIIIDKTNPTDVVNLTQSTGTTDQLEIIEGTFVETTTSNVSGAGKLVMSGGTYRTTVAGVAPNYVPQLAGVFELTGGTIDLNASGAQILKGNRDYRNLTFSTGGTKTVSSSPDSIIGTVTVQTGVILDVENNSFGDSNTNLTVNGTGIYRTSGSGTKPDASGTYDLAATSTVEFYGTSATIVRLGTTAISYGNVVVSGTNVSSTSTTTGILFKSLGSFTVKQGATFTFRQPGGLNGLVNSAVSSTNSPTVTIENTPALSTIVYNGAGQSLTGRADYGNLTINNTSGALTTSGDVTVSGTLTLTSGIVTTGANTIAVTNDTTPISGGSATAYVSGKLRLTYPATGTNVARTFPIGKGGAYRPLVFSYDTAPASRTVLIEQFEGAFPTALPSTGALSGNRYWNIIQSSIGASYKVTLNSGPSAITGSVIILRREGTGAASSNDAITPNYTNATSFATTNISNDVALGTCTVCTKLRFLQCGTPMTFITDAVQASPIAGATQYRFNIVRTDDALDDRTVTVNRYYFTYGELPGRLQYGKSYNVRVAVFIGSWLPFGPVCTLIAPPEPAIIFTRVRDFQCNKTLRFLSSRVEAMPVYSATSYEFEVTSAAGTFVKPSVSYHFSLTGSVPGGALPNTAYTIRVRTFIGNTLLRDWGAACVVTTPSARMSETNVSDSIFNVKAFPNPFASHFSLDIESSSDAQVELKVYDMIGRQLEVRKATVSELSVLEVGRNYPSGVYNIVVSQGDKVKSLRMIKR